MADEEQRLSLEVERLRAAQLWQATGDDFVPMSVAAAATFHQVHYESKAVVHRSDYDDALNIAASALSRLLPVFTIGAVTLKHVELPVNLVTHRFTLGARQLRSHDGQVFEPLVVRRTDLLFAMSIIKRTGLPFSFARIPTEPPELPIDELVRRAVEILGSEKALAEALDVREQDVRQWLSGEALPQRGGVYFAAIEAVTTGRAAPRSSKQ